MNTTEKLKKVVEILDEINEVGDGLYSTDYILFAETFKKLNELKDALGLRVIAEAKDEAEKSIRVAERIVEKIINKEAR